MDEILKLFAGAFGWVKVQKKRCFVLGFVGGKGIGLKVEQANLW